MQTLAQLMDRMSPYYRVWYEVVFQSDKGRLMEIRLLDENSSTVSVYYKTPGKTWENCFVQLDDRDWPKKVCNIFCQDPDENGWYLSDATLIHIDAHLHVMTLFRETIKFLVEEIKNDAT